MFIDIKMQGTPIKTIIQLSKCASST